MPKQLPRSSHKEQNYDQIMKPKDLKEQNQSILFST